MRPGRFALAVVLAAVVAGGCGSRDAGSDRVLQFTTWKSNNPGAWDEAILRFEETHPGVEVRRQVGPHSSTAFHDLLAQKLKNRDSELDVFLMDVIWPAEFAAAGWTRDLSDRLPQAEREAFLPGTIAASTWSGRLHGVPFYVDAGLLYSRSDLLEAHGFGPPETWEQLVRQAKEIVAAERSRHPRLAGYVGQFKQYEGLVCNMLELVVSRGGRLIDPERNRSALVEPATLAALRWTRDQLVGTVAPRAVLTYEEPESLAAFVQGNAVFLRSWPYAWSIVNDEQRSRVAGRVVVTALPHGEGHTSVAALGGWQFGISAFSKRSDLAWQFVEFMTSTEMQRLFAVEASLAPARAALYEDPDVLDANPQFADQVAAFSKAIPRPVTPLYPAVSSVLQRAFSEVLTGAETVDTAARRADDEIDGLLHMAPPPQ